MVCINVREDQIGMTMADKGLGAKNRRAIKEVFFACCFQAVFEGGMAGPDPEHDSSRHDWKLGVNT